MKEFTIDCKLWSRGTPEGGSLEKNYLRNGDGTMCCMGFWCNQVKRVSLAAMDGKATPSRIEIHELKKKTLPHDHSISIQTQLIGLNDSPFTMGCKTSAEQRKRIADTFALAGYKVNFINTES